MEILTFLISCIDLLIYYNSLQDSDSKILVSKLESSPEGEYLGMVMESK